MSLRSTATLACTIVLATTSVTPVAAQMPMSHTEPGIRPEAQASAAAKPLPSPAAKASVMLNGKSVTIDYNAPSLRGRKVMGQQVPYGKVWRTGANPATTLKTATSLKIGTLDITAGTYTIYSLPAETSPWMLIINKQTGQWGTVYNESQDLGRTPLTGKTLSTPQEKMSISFEHTSGPSTELHIKWDNADESVKVTAQ